MTASQQRVGVADLRDDLEAAVGEEVGKALTQQGGVLGDHDPHGITASTRVPPPAGCRRRAGPPSAATRSASPRRPEPPSGVGAADAVVGHLERDADRGDRALTVAASPRRVLTHVGQRLAGDEVGRRLDLGREPLRRGVHPHRQRRAVGQRRERGCEAFLREHRRVDARARARAAPRRRPGAPRPRCEQRVRWPGFCAAVTLPRREPERDRDQALLRPVVEVPFDPAPLLVPGGDDAGARLLHLRQLRAELGFEARVLEREPRGGCGGVDQARLLAQRRVVDERRERLAVVVDGAATRRRARRSRTRCRSRSVPTRGRAWSLARGCGPAPGTRSRRRRRSGRRLRCAALERACGKRHTVCRRRQQGRHGPPDPCWPRHRFGGRPVPPPRRQS